MTILNPGLTGAKRQSWEKYNPRDVLRDIIRSHPKASEAEVRERVWEIVRNEREYLPTIFDYWFTNNYRQFFVEEIAEHSVAIREKHRTVTKRGSNQPTRREIDAVKAELAPILMDQILSNGKALRDATFGECAAESGWLRDVAKQGRPTAIVGKKLTEKELWSLRARSFKSTSSR
jgi:hypothetical protein